MDGLEVLGKLKSDPVLKTLPVVVLTSSRESSDLDDCYRLGVMPIVVKTNKVFGVRGRRQRTWCILALINEPPSASVKEGIEPGLNLMGRNAHENVRCEYYTWKTMKTTHCLFKVRSTRKVFDCRINRVENAG